MTRPSFQFYPADWRASANLRRCSAAARGVWMDVLCLLHDSDEYGLVRWPLPELAAAAGASVKHVRELVGKNVLKGSDDELTQPFIYIPRSGRQDGAPVTLVPAQKGPIWYSSRMVKDEHVRLKRGEGTRFGDPKGASPEDALKGAPMPPFSDGPSSSSSSSSSSSKKEKPASASRKAGLPPGFGISERVRAWAAERGYRNVEPQLEALVSYAKRSGAKYADWDEALMNAIRGDWAKTGDRAAASDVYAGAI